MYEEIKSYFEQNKLPKFRFKQFEQAVFKEFISNFDDITVYPKYLREELNKKFEISSLFLVESHRSGNTVKFLLKMKDKQFVESGTLLLKIKE